MTISDTDLQALIDAEAKATKGEWQWVDNDDAPVQPKKNGWSMARALFAHGMNHNVLDGQEYAIEGLWTDLAFIASLRNAAPSLLAELRASREMIKHHEAAAMYVDHLDSCAVESGCDVCTCGLAELEAALASKGER